MQGQIRRRRRRRQRSRSPSTQTFPYCFRRWLLSAHCHVGHCAAARAAFLLSKNLFQAWRFSSGWFSSRPLFRHIGKAPSPTCTLAQSDNQSARQASNRSRICCRLDVRSRDKYDASFGDMIRNKMNALQAVWQILKKRMNLYDIIVFYTDKFPSRSDLKPAEKLI